MNPVSSRVLLFRIEAARRWTRSDELLFHDHVERRTEIAALARKLQRQERAIATMRMCSAMMWAMRRREPDRMGLSWRLIRAGERDAGAIGRSGFCPSGFLSHSPTPAGPPFVFAAV
ncbi:hypothetical protein ACU8NH_37770 (plasmid) [Rhizobium leguminosarum]|jgi:hypothetical protein|uniref:DUF2285 domain-containing protein n=1 Tax=Rhizobium brockwellii TaxID=3019932 RepID=A0ABU3YWV7_9HYPH|nr:MULTISPECIES: hypothetical protein [Rhizobium]MDV4158812.1 hypothetical protein [Rhizobium brockwellii]MDV4183334.1 hypothetical protein [Rhizobium brockwellii]MDV4190333.1 hypothetical protein [Rhizobium brockwellii]TAW06169.1 hypothetical protein ELI25_31945 [Rhizobium ruizarguesonis]TAY63420.1 hypothetical protein ELH84_30960 [Rhizobium ruizarguesonis]